MEKNIESTCYPVRYADMKTIKKLTQDKTILKIVNKTYFS